MRIYGGPVPGTHFHEVDLFGLFGVPIRFDTETSNGLVIIHFFNGSANRPTYSLKMKSIEPGRVESAIKHICKILCLSNIDENLLERICQYIHQYIGIKLLGWPKYSNL